MRPHQDPNPKDLILTKVSSFRKSDIQITKLILCLVYFVDKMTAFHSHRFSVSG